MAKRITQERFLKWARIELCAKGLRWLRSNKLTPRRAWDRCHRPAWMLWALYILNIDSMSGPVHLAALDAGWNGDWADFSISPTACAAIRKAIPWPRIAKRLAEVIGE